MFLFILSYLNPHYSSYPSLHPLDKEREREREKKESCKEKREREKDIERKGERFRQRVFFHYCEKHMGWYAYGETHQ